MADQDQFNLNQGQKAAAEAIFDFLLSDETEMNLSGPAGTGKTYLMDYVRKAILPRYNELCRLLGKPVVYDEVAMTATTHKAAAVLSKSVGRDCRTVHSYFGLTPSNDYQTGRTRLVRNPRTWEKKINEIIFIDEASMIDSQLYNEIKLSCENCKVIFVGDMYQLNPVGERISRIYDQGLRTVHLTQQMRNAGQPALMELCDQFREVVRTGEFTPVSLVPGVIDHLKGEALQVEIDKHFMQLNTNDRILAYTNESVIDNNLYIRDLRGLPDIYQPGETLINVTPVKVKQGNKQIIIPAETEVEITGYRGQTSDVVGKDEQGNDLSITSHVYTVLSPQGVLDVRVPMDNGYYRKLISYFKSRKQWYNFYFLQDYFGDIRPRDSSTVHKAQGSTHDTVFVDLENISRNNMIHEVQRMLYVAFSRPRNRLILAGDLNARYGKLIQGE